MKRIPIFMLMFFLAACGGQTPHPATPSPVPASTATSTPTAIPVTAIPTPYTWCTDPLPEGFAIIGYLPEYQELNPEWGKCLTDLIYFSAEPRADGTLDASRLDENVLAQLHEMQTQYGTRIHISIGGWERGADFAAMTADPQTRAHFVESLVEYLRDHKLNGADFDWEFPANETEFQNYILLLQEVHADFQPKRLILSVALSPDLEFPLKDFAIVDRIHIMSYDRAPRHSTYEQAVKDLQTFLDAGLPREKLILGVPFYGRKINAPNVEATYADIVNQYHPAPAVDEVGGIYFNGITTIQRKICFAHIQSIGGVMIWEMGQDTTDTTSLLRAISQRVVNGC
jgi:GH18 family chitinase